MSNVEREIIAMLRADSDRHPILVRYIQAIESGAHLRPKSKGVAVRVTRELTVEDIKRALGAA